MHDAFFKSVFLTELTPQAKYMSVLFSVATQQIQLDATQANDLIYSNYFRFFSISIISVSVDTEDHKYHVHITCNWQKLSFHITASH